MDVLSLKAAVKNAVKEALNSSRIMYRLYYPNSSRLYGTGTTEGSFWPTAQKAKEAREKSGIKDLEIYEYDTEVGARRAEVMI